MRSALSQKKKRVLPKRQHSPKQRRYFRSPYRTQITPRSRNSAKNSRRADSLSRNSSYQRKVLRESSRATAISPMHPNQKLAFSSSHQRRLRNSQARARHEVP